jgi:hypothetical protein
MSFASKIEEWMKEVEERPESAATIVRLAVRRLRELSERNEQLLAENIALQDGSRVEEYRKRIVHLEYQLDLLKQRFSMDNVILGKFPDHHTDASTLNLLIYNAHGRIFRVELDAEAKEIGSHTGEMITDQEPPRLLAVDSNENLLLLFTSGRVETCTLNDIPTMELSGAWAWDQAPLPNEPHAGEQLACLLPISQLPLSEFFLQVSRRGCTKKALTSMSESILNNHFIGHLIIIKARYHQHKRFFCAPVFVAQRQKIKQSAQWYIGIFAKVQHQVIVFKSVVLSCYSL